jgi:hypothetical protein
MLPTKAHSYRNRSVEVLGLVAHKNIPGSPVLPKFLKLYYRVALSRECRTRQGAGLNLNFETKQPKLETSTLTECKHN